MSEENGYLWRAAVLIPGPPATKGSVRAFMRGGRAMVVNDNHRTKPWAHALSEEMHRCRPRVFPQALAVSVWVCVPRPASHYGTGRNSRVLRATAPDWPTGKPDLDKVLRAVLDAGTGIWWLDDSHVVHPEAGRGYCDRHSPGMAGTVVTAWDVRARPDAIWPTRAADVVAGLPTWRQAQGEPR